MDYTCWNCKHKKNWSCEEYHEGELLKRRCKDGFDLDVNTLPKETKDVLAKLAELLSEVE